MRLKDKKISLIEYRIIGRNELNQPIYGWGPKEGGENIWCYVRHLSGREIHTAVQVQAEETILFEINWRDDVNMTDRVLFRGEEYDIVRIDPFEFNKTDIRIFAKRRE
jgi:SPP1 family predicted phage head-tail adaptor